MRAALLSFVLLGAALPLSAEVAPEVSTLGTSKVTLYPQPFLDADELAMLRLVASNPDALALFVPGGSGYAALALSPEDGFLTEGAPAASAVAIADLPDAAQATAAALEGCDAKRIGKSPCVIVLEVAPAE